MFRGRREERREEREATRYQMRQRMISIGDDYVIENDRGERVYKLDGKALRIRKTIHFEDMDGHELAKIQERMLHIKDSMEIEGPDGNRIALVKKAMITPLRERWIAKVEDGPDLHTKGNIVEHEYTIERDGDKVAEVSKRWFRIRDTYGVTLRELDLGGGHAVPYVGGEPAFDREPVFVLREQSRELVVRHRCFRGHKDRRMCRQS